MQTEEILTELLEKGKVVIDDGFLGAKEVDGGGYEIYADGSIFFYESALETATVLAEIMSTD